MKTPLALLVLFVLSLFAVAQSSPPTVRLSGSLSARPSANTAVGAAYYATDNGIVYRSFGDNWGVRLVPDPFTSYLSGSLSAQPTAGNSIGAAYYAIDNGLTYEAFPDGWATFPSRAFSALTDGTTVTITCNPARPRQNFTLTILSATVNRVLAFSGLQSGMAGTLVTNGTGSITLPTTSILILSNTGGTVLSSGSIALTGGTSSDAWSFFATGTATSFWTTNLR